MPYGGLSGRCMWCVLTGTHSGPEAVRPDISGGMEMRRGFTLMEMLVVMAIAMILMGMIASAWGKIKQGQDLSNGASTVQGALQTARAQAMQLNKVVYVYFLDGGKWDRNYYMDVDGNEFVETPDSFLRAYTAYEVPYELLLVTSDKQEISREKLPNGVAWLSLGAGAGKYDTSDGNLHQFAINKNQLLRDNGRNCSLVVCFAPTGNAWAEAAPKRYSTQTDFRNTLKYIRIFMLDDLVATPTNLAAVATTIDSVSYPAANAIGTDHWLIAVDHRQGVSSAKPNYNANLAKITWRTVVMNYTTGLVDTIEGKDEPLP